MRETACKFGPERNLIGILSEPEVKDGRPNLPAVLMLNAGLVHRVGPHRMSVKLARRLAACGIFSLRFDMGGRGDSESAHHEESDERRIFADANDAMDFLEGKNIAHSFVLFGLCGGADKAHAIALRDSRVVGSILLDGHGYWTWRSYVVHYLPRLFRPRALFNFIRRALSPPQKAPPRFGITPFTERFGPRREVEHEVHTLVQRGAQMLYVYTGGANAYYNYSKQFYDMFDGLKSSDRIEVEFYPNCDHLFMFEEDRERLFARIVEWFSSRNWSTG
jgi:hypothetical protein